MSVSWKKVLRLALIFAGAGAALFGAFIAGAWAVTYFDAKSGAYAVEWRRDRLRLPSPEFFTTADEAALLKNITADEAWEHATPDEVLSRLDAMESRLRREAKTAKPSSYHLISDWRHALGELALRPGFREEATQRFQRVVTADDRAMDEALFCRLAWLELEHRLMRDRSEPLATPPARDAEKLWQDASRVADELVAEYEREREARKKSPTPYVWKAPSRDKSFFASGRSLQQTGCDALSENGSVSSAQISEWQWGIPCGTGSEGFYTMRSMALLLTSLHENNAGVIHKELVHFPGMPIVVFDRDPRAQEIRIRRILDALAEKSSTDLSVEWLGRIIATRRTDCWYVESFAHVGIRFASPGGDAVAGALLRLLDAPGKGNAKDGTDKEAVEALRFLTQSAPEPDTIRSVRFDSNQHDIGHGGPFVEIVSEHSRSCGSYGIVFPLLKPARPISEAMRKKILSRLPPEKPEAK